MGTWGVDLYSDDIACEVRDEYLDALKVGLAGSEAANQVLHRRRVALENCQIACGVYFSLAKTAWRYGRLTEEVKSAALALLESGGDLSIWAQDAPAELPARRAVLQRLEIRLRSPQPQIQPVKLKPEVGKVVRTDLPAGTALLLDLPSGHRAALVMVWDEVLEYRVWCHPEQGAPDLCDGSDYFYAFSSHAEALDFADRTAGAEAPLALVLQCEYIDEPEDGCFVHVRQERITEWPVAFLSRLRRTPQTLPNFFAPDAPANRLDILRGLA